MKISKIVHRPFFFQVNGTQLAVGCADGTVALWYENGQQSFEVGCDEAAGVGCLRWSVAAATAHLPAVGRTDGSVVVWNTARKAPTETLPTAHTGTVRDLCWISANRLVSSGDDGLIHILQIGSASAVQTIRHTVGFFRVLIFSCTLQL